MKIRIMTLLLFITVCSFGQTTPRNYSFNGNMSEEVLRNYLSRSMTVSGLLFGSVYYDGNAPYAEDDERMVINVGAKFVGRSIYMWGKDDNINNTSFLSQAKTKIDRMHLLDPEIIFQACIFEIVTPYVNNVTIPAYVFQAFDLPIEDRNFRYADMYNISHNGQWGGVSKGSAPDVTRIETRLWYYYLATQYINIGIEAIHWGQVQMTAFDDQYNGYKSWFELIGKVRDFARIRARRKFVLNDGHTRPGIVVGGKLLLDFHSFPMRPMNISGQPYSVQLIFSSRTMYGQSSGGTTYSGWQCTHLPYIVEFDNYGISSNPGIYDSSGGWIWGYDEITWFSLQPEADRNSFLDYAVKWIKVNDPTGNLEMPGRRVVSTTTGGKIYRANTAAGNMATYGYSQESTIKQIWLDDMQSAVTAVDADKKYSIMTNANAITIKGGDSQFEISLLTLNGVTIMKMIATREATISPNQHGVFLVQVKDKTRVEVFKVVM